MRRCLVLAASATRWCPVCHGTGRVQVRALPVGEFVESPCLHCQRDRMPVAYLPTYTDRRAS